MKRVLCVLFLSCLVLGCGSAKSEDVPASLNGNAVQEIPSEVESRAVSGVDVSDFYKGYAGDVFYLSLVDGDDNSLADIPVPEGVRLEACLVESQSAPVMGDVKDYVDFHFHTINFSYEGMEYAFSSSSVSFETYMSVTGFADDVVVNGESVYGHDDEGCTLRSAVGIPNDRTLVCDLRHFDYDIEDYVKVDLDSYGQSTVDFLLENMAK